MADSELLRVVLILVALLISGWAVFNILVPLAIYGIGLFAGGVVTLFAMDSDSGCLTRLVAGVLAIGVGVAFCGISWWGINIILPFLARVLGGG